MIKGSTPFRFENTWLRFYRFNELIGTKWAGMQLRGSFSFILVEKLKVLKFF